jgi:hypothetical protein
LKKKFKVELFWKFFVVKLYEPPNSSSISIRRSSLSLPTKKEQGSEKTPRQKPNQFHAENIKTPPPISFDFLISILCLFHFFFTYYLFVTSL